MWKYRTGQTAVSVGITNWQMAVRHRSVELVEYESGILYTRV